MLLIVASGITGGMITDNWRKHGLEKCTTLEERNRVPIFGKK